jgi:hypothetical protein
MIGYNALIDIYGTFSPSEEMIGLDCNSQWKVWINEDFNSLNKRSDVQLERK